MDAAPVYGSGIGVVTRSPEPGLGRFLGSLPAASTRPLHVVVVEIGDGEGAVGEGDGLGRVGVGVHVVRIGERVARAAAVNRGVAGMPADVGWVFVADPDVECGPALIDTLLAAAAGFPLAGALGPRLRRRDGGAVASAGSVPSRRDARRGALSVAAPPATGPVGWVSASCLLLRRLAWDSVDGFDPRHLGPADSVDLGDRLGRAGWRVVHVPGAEAVVGAGASGMLESERLGLRRFAQDRR